MAQNTTATTTTMPFDYYAELQVEPTASLRQITNAYHRLARVRHPDRNHGRERDATVSFQRLQGAYETLADAGRRARYDKTRPAPAPAVPPPPTSHNQNTATNDDDDEDEDMDWHFFDDDDDDNDNENKKDKDNGDEDEDWHFFGDDDSDNEFSTGDFGFAHYFQTKKGTTTARPPVATPPSTPQPQPQPQDEVRNRDEYRAALVRDAYGTIGWEKDLVAMFEADYRKRKQEEQRNNKEDGRIKVLPADAVREWAEAAARQTVTAILTQERKEQEQRWRDLAPETGGNGESKEQNKRQRQISCFHSCVCIRHPKPSDWKCDDCWGATDRCAYECPYCNIIICSHCFNCFNDLRCKVMGFARYFKDVQRPLD